MANRIQGTYVYVFDGEEDRILRRVIEQYILDINARESSEKNRDLNKEERFHASPAFARVLDSMNISREYWNG